MNPQDNKQRTRITLLCAQCKRRKVKCDRNLPCLSCVKHNGPEKCAYFGDQVVALALALTNTGAVSVFRAFTGEQEKVGESRDVPAAKRVHVEMDPASVTPDRQQMADELSRLKTKLDHLESSMERGPPSNSIYPMAPAGPYFPPPAMPMPQMAVPMYTNSGPFPAATPSFGPSPIPGPVPGHGMILPNNGHLAPSPRNFYTPPGNSPHLILNYSRLGTPNMGLNPNSDLRPFNFSHTAPKLHPFPGPVPGPVPVPVPGAGAGPNNNNTMMGFPGPGPFLQPINTANTPGFTPPASGLSTEPPVTPNTYIGINPCDSLDPDEVFDLYSGYNPIHSGEEGRNTNHGPFSYYSYVQKDPLLIGLWDFMRTPNEKTQKPLISSLDELEEDILYNKDAFLNHKIKVELNKRTISLGLTVFEGEVDLNMHLMGRIKLMLPTQKTVLVLVDRFFKSVYPYFPVLDETHFRKQVKRILGCFSQREEKYTEIRCTKRDDTAILGILLIVLRISYLSALSNNRSENERILSSHGSPKLEETKYILTHPININVVPVARLCLDQYDLYQRANITVLQCAVLIRIYFSIAPEQGDSADGYESNVFNVMCIQTAYCMGLNRDPRKIHGYSANPLRDNLSRKLWYFLKFMDLKMSLQFGFPLMIDDSYNDIQALPCALQYKSDGKENMEAKVCDIIGLMVQMYGLMRAILKGCISIRLPMKVCELTEAMSKFEAETEANLGTLPKLLRSDAYAPEHLYVKVLHTKTYLNIRLFTLSIFFHMFLNYEKSKKYDLAFFYLRKFISISCGEILVEVLNMIKKPKLFDPESVVPGLILNPPIVFVIHKSNQLNLRVINMLNYMISKMESDEEMHDRNLRTSYSYKENYNRVFKLAKLLENINKFNNSCLSMLGHRFLYAWRVSKIHSHLLDMVISKPFRKKQLETGMDPIPMTPERVKDLLDITETAFSKMKSCCHKNHTSSKKPHTQGNRLEQETCAQQENSTKTKTETKVPSVYQIQSSYIQHGLPKGDLRDSIISDGFQGHLSDIPSSSTLTFDFADLELGNTAEIDSLWQQINNFKNFSKFENEDNWGNAAANDGEIVDNGREWYQRILTNVAPDDGYPPAEGNAPLGVYPNLPI